LYRIIINIILLKRKFLTNLTLLISLNLLVKPFWVLGIDLTVQNRVGAGEYGFYFSLLSFSLLLNIIQDMGIASYNNRNIARNHESLATLLPNILILKLILTLVYFTASLVIAKGIGYGWIHVKLLLVLLFNQFLSSMNLYLRSNISGLQLFRTDSLLSVTDRFLMITICSILLWGNITSSAFRIEWFVYAQSAAYFITTLIILTIVLNHTYLNKLTIDFKVIRKLLRNSSPYAILGFLMVLYYRTDSVMLERMLPDGPLQAGIYAQGFRILDAASMLGFLFAGILLPMFAKMIKHKEPVIQLFRFSFFLLIIPALTGAIALNRYSFEVMDLLYKDHAGEAAEIFGILMISFIFLSCSIISGTLLTANGNIRNLNIVALFGVLMNIMLNILFIPRYQGVGSAIASTATQFIIAALQLMLIANIFKSRPSARTILKTIAFAVSLVITGAAVKHQGIQWFYGFLIIAICSTGLAFSMKLLTIREIKDALL
jgi:O-antigen/teichoic acid export membrane protein